jgi:TolB-like protein
VLNTAQGILLFQALRMGRAELPRKLKAILAADVEGYSRLVGKDERMAARLLARCRAILDSRINKYGGNLFGEAGDGFMVEFDNVENAVRCAVSIQKNVAKANAQRRSTPAWLRIGVSLGDIIDDGRTKHGNAINIAARLQSVADPGGVCITSAVFEQVANRLAYAFDELGPAKLKNIPRTVELVKVRWSENQARSTHLQPASGVRPSLAVLPFVFHGGEEYLAEGLAEEIISELSRYRWLSVVSKGSSFAYKGRTVDMRLIAQELGVRYLIEGSLRRDNSDLRINLHVVSGETGEDLWSDRFNRPAREVLELKEDVVLGIAGAVEPKVRSAEIQRARKKPTHSLTAYDYYLQALPYRGAISSIDNQRALDLLNEAIALDPKFAPALALASICYATRKDQGWGALDQREVQRALQLARSAVESDFDDSTVLNLAGHTIASVGGDISGAIALIDRSLAISPSYPKDGRAVA